MFGLLLPAPALGLSGRERRALHQLDRKCPESRAGILRMARLAHRKLRAYHLSTGTVLRRVNHYVTYRRTDSCASDFAGYVYVVKRSHGTVT